MRASVTITYVGLGSGHRSDITAGALDALATASIVFACGRGLATSRVLVGERTETRELPRDVVDAVAELLRAKGPVVRAFSGSCVHHAFFWQEVALLREAGAHVRVLPGLSPVTLRERRRALRSEPLFEKRIVITRAEEQSEAFADRLRAAGAEVLSLPAIAMKEPGKGKPAERAVEALASGGYAWVVFTSQNGVRYFARAMERLGLDARVFAQTKIATIGPETTRSLAELGLTADLSPKEFVAEALARDLLRALGTETGKIGKRERREGGQTSRVLLPRAKVAREVLPQELRERGVHVEVLPVYETVDPSRDVIARGREAIAKQRVDAVAFTSSSTVERFVRLYGTDVFERGARVATIGPITSATAKTNGLRVDIEAKVYTTAGLTDALAEASWT